MKICVIIPVHNEVSSIGQVVRSVRAVLDGLPVDYQVTVVDDGSEDGTGEEAASAGAVVLSRPYRNGNGAAVKHGIRSVDGGMQCWGSNDERQSTPPIYTKRPARVAELADALDLGSSPARGAGSSPVSGTCWLS